MYRIGGIAVAFIGAGLLYALHGELNILGKSIAIALVVIGIGGALAGNPPDPPPTERQLKFIATLRAERQADHLAGVEPETLDEASALIDQLKSCPYRVSHDRSFC